MALLSWHVGINAYQTSPLRGCVNDAYDWQEWAKQRGSASPFLLLDAQATRDAMMGSLSGIIGAAKRGDFVLATYSGHGTWTPDNDGDEPDRRDEALVPHDYRRSGLIIDDELHNVFSKARHGVRVLFVSDSCNSGTVTRAGIDATGPESHAVPRYLPPGDLLSGEDLERAHRAAQAPLGGKPRAGAVLLSGCADPEYSYDAYIDGKPCGAFTHHALRTFRTTAPKTLNAWHKAIRQALPSSDYPQTPQLQAKPWQRYWKIP